MRVVVALGGNALLRRGEPMTFDNQRRNVRTAARAIAPIARRHSLVISHGNGPQVGLLALQAMAYQRAKPYPLDVLGAESEGMIGYLIEQELRNHLPELELATLLTMVEVDASDRAFDEPTKPIGPIYGEAEARQIQKERGWTMRRDGDHWRRVVPSPVPLRVVELPAIRWLLGHGTLVICAGGGGIPIIRGAHGEISGVEAVIDKDRASALLAEELKAEVLILATDVDAVYTNWGSPDAMATRRAGPEELSRQTFEPGSMGPKVEAACHFVDKAPPGTSRRAVIGALGELAAMLEGTAGTQVIPDA